MPKLFIVATTFWPIFPLFPTPTTTSFPPELIDVEIASTELTSASWAIPSDSYRPSSCVRAFRSVLITCRAVANASLLLISSMDPPASDIAADERGDVGVNGSWNMAVEANPDPPITNGYLPESFLCDEDWDWEFTSSRASWRAQNPIANISPRSRGPSEVYHFVCLKSQLKEMGRSCGAEGSVFEAEELCARSAQKMKEEQDQAI